MQGCRGIRSRRSWLLICKRLPILFGRFVSAVLASAVSGATSPRWRFCFAVGRTAVRLGRRGDRPRRRVVRFDSRFSSSNYAWSQNDWQQNPRASGFRVPWRFQALHLDAGVPRCVALSLLSVVRAALRLLRRLRVSLLCLGAGVSVLRCLALGARGNLSFPKFHRADSNGGPPGAGRWRGGSQRRSLTVDR